MTVPPPPPVPAARTAGPPRRDGAGSANAAAHEFTDLVREHLESERARARTRALEDPAAGSEHGQGAGTTGAAAAVPVLPVTLARLAGPQLPDQPGTELVEASADGAASECDLAGSAPAPGATSPVGAPTVGSPTAGAPTAGAPTVPVATDESAAAGSPTAGSTIAGTDTPITGPDTPAAGSVAAASSVPAPVVAGPASSSQPASHQASGLVWASEPTSTAQPSSLVDAAAASVDAAAASDATDRSAGRLDGTGPVVPAAPALSASLATSPTGSATGSTSAGAVLDQALPVVNRLVSRGDGTHRMTLKLYPVELGEIQLTVTVRGDRVDVTFAAGAQAREALRDGAGQLRGLLELAGRTTGNLLVRDLPGASQAASTQHASNLSFTSTGTPFGDTGTGGDQWQEQGHDSTGPGGWRPHGDPGRTEGAPTGPTPTAPTPPTGSATALDVRL